MQPRRDLVLASELGDGLGTPAALSVTEITDDAAAPTPFYAEIVTSATPAAVGVPESTPVTESSVNPAGIGHRPGRRLHPDLIHPCRPPL